MVVVVVVVTVEVVTAVVVVVVVVVIVLEELVLLVLAAAKIVVVLEIFLYLSSNIFSIIYHGRHYGSEYRDMGEHQCRAHVVRIPSSVGVW